MNDTELPAFSLTTLFTNRLAGAVQFDTEFVLSETGSDFLHANRGLDYPPGTVFKLEDHGVSPHQSKQMLLLTPADGTGSINVPVDEPLFSELIPPSWLMESEVDLK